MIADPYQTLAGGGFRPGEDLAPEELPAQEPAGLSFAPASDAGGTDFDVLMGYQIFLGRDPESSFVIADAKTSPVGAFLRALMGSGEFQSAVLDRLVAGRALPHETASLAPSAEQMDWLFRHVRLPATTQVALRAAPDWRAWLQTLAAAPGFPHAPGRGAPEPAKPGAAAQAADDGFVLVHLEQPKAGERLQPGGLVSGSGWAIAPADVAHVAVHLDDTLLTHARYGLPRPDVARNFPHYRHVDHCGFAFTAEVPAGLLMTATSQLVVSVRTVRGELGRKSVRLQLPAQKPAAVGGGQDGWPIRLAVDEAGVDGNRIFRARGWAVSHAPIRAVTATLGAIALRVTFGLPRTDIARLHNGYSNAFKSGFTIVHRLPPNLAGGPGFMRVEAEDELGQTRHAIVPVAMPGLAGGADERQTGPVRGGLTAATLSVAGVLEVAGWAFAERGPASVAIELDGETLGVAPAGLARPDIGRLYLGEAAAAHSGFDFSHTLDEPPAAGPHRLTLIVVGAGAERQMGYRLVAGQAQPLLAGPDTPHDMRLEVDHPLLDGDAARTSIRGALAISGWVVARHGVTGVSVFNGERLLGRAHCGMRREDIGSAFPDYEGSLLAGYALVLPPGTLTQGEHTIRIVAAGTAQRSDARAATLERRFSIRVEHSDALPPESALRTRIAPAEAAFGLRLLKRQGYHPSFHLTVGPDEEAADSAALAATLWSLVSQAYPVWTATVHLSSRAEAGHPGLRAIVEASSGRIVLAWPGKAAKARRGGGQPRFIMRLRAGDGLGADALLAFAAESATERAADLIYADDVRADPAQNRRQPFFKPDWSPNLLLAMNYVGRAWCATPEVVERAGLAESASDYDTVLRLTGAASQIRHVPRVLFDIGARGDTKDQEAAALAACLARRGLAAHAEPAPVAGTWRVRRTLAKPKRGRGVEAGRVSIIMPTCGARGLVRTAIETLRATTGSALPGGRQVEIVVLDNTPPGDTAMGNWLRRHADRVIGMPSAFNWSQFNNLGARAATGEYLLFLNDDIEATQPGWLEALLEHAQQPDVGVVGARLLYPDGLVQHAGQYLAGAHARHAFRFSDSTMPGPFGLAGVAREVISVTGACQLVRAEVFCRLGGFEEAHSVVNNDVDFCLRAWRAGLSVIYTPHATLTHHELASRAALEDSYDEARFAGTWRAVFAKGDPFRHPRLAADSDDYSPDPEPATLLHAGRRGPEAEAVQRILAVKLDHIGDYLTCLPALRSLKRRFANAVIDLLAAKATADLVQDDGLLGEVIVFDFFHARSGDGQVALAAETFAALAARLAPKRYDIAIDLRMHPETREVLRHTGAGFCAGYDHDSRFPWLDVALEWEGDQRLAAKRSHVSERLVALVSTVEDACRGEAAPEAAPLSPASVPALAALPAAFTARPLVCMHPGAGNTTKQWPAADYALLADLLAAEAGVHVVLVGAADEAPVADQVLRRVAMPGCVESLVGQVRLRDLAQVMRACVLFVGNDSGPKHLAASLGLPTVGIHSGVVDAAEWAPLGPQALALRRRMVCSPCYLEFAADCPRDLACLTGLRPAEVFAVCRRLLA